jgi:DNA-binding CsgD family transcriptional regulator
MNDTIAIFEAAYSLDGDEQAWLSRLAEAIQLRIDGTRGIYAQSYDATQTERVVVRATAECGLDEGMVATAVASVALPESEHKPLVALLRRPFVASLRAAPAALARLGLDGGQAETFETNVDRFLLDYRYVDQWWINAQDPTRHGCIFVASLSARGQPGPREVHAWQCAAAHVASAFRIRRQLAAWRPDGAVASRPAPEAVLRPDGTLQHAEAPATSPEAREVLRAGVLAVDRARGALRRRDPERAAEIWQALVAGRWSLLDHFDSDGRRFVVAHRNDAGVPDARGLTRRECQVLAHVVLGQSNKMVAYELGLSASTVAGHLASARTKLGLPSAAVLRQILARGAGPKAYAFGEEPAA